jgi:uncharacterized protein (DUF342 family)
VRNEVTEPLAAAAAGWYRVTISPDSLTATLEVAPPRADDTTPDLDGALAALAGAGVTYGVDAEDVARALLERGKPVLVAQGRPPRDGEDGQLEVASGLLEIGGRPRVRDDGRVDLFDLNLIHVVREGQVLAQRVPPSPHEPGMSVRGRTLAAHSGRVAPGIAGRGTRLRQDGQEIIATVTGHAVVVGEQLSVSSIYQVRGDVSVATGHVQFVGSVVVGGDVRPGYRVQADGDVEIHGNVNAGIVEAGGNISVRYGILGQARVVASGTVRAKFVEYAEVRAGAEVWVSDGIVQSTLSAGAGIEVLGRYGSVVGGHIFARKSLTARELGSARGIRTTIAVGADPELLPEAKRLAVHQAELERKIPVVETRLDYLQAQAATGRLNRRGAQELESMTAQLQALLDERDGVTTRQREVAAQLSEITAAFVDARDVCHPEVYVAIGTDNITIRQALLSVRFRRSALLSRIEMSSLDT